MISHRRRQHEIGAPAAGFAYDNERPRHQVELAAFEIDRTAGRQRRVYSQFMEETGRRAADVLGARRRGRWAQHGDGPARRRSTRLSRSSTSPGTRPTPSPAGRASGCRPSRSGRRPTRAARGRRPGLGVDLLALPRLPRLRGLPLPRVLRGLLRRRVQGPARRLLGDPPRASMRPSFRNWDLPQRRQIFAGIRCARDA